MYVARNKFQLFEYLQSLNTYWCQCHKKIMKEEPLIDLLALPQVKSVTPPGGLEPPTFRLTAERASQLRHGGILAFEYAHFICCCSPMGGRHMCPKQAAD